MWSMYQHLGSLWGKMFKLVWLVIFYRLYHSKSSFFTSIWENMFGTFSNTVKVQGGPVLVRNGFSSSLLMAEHKRVFVFFTPINGVTVDGKSRAPVEVGSWFLPLFTRFYTSQLGIAGFLPSTVSQSP